MLEKTKPIVAPSSDSFVLAVIGFLEVRTVVIGSLFAASLDRPSVVPVRLSHDPASAGSEQPV